MTRDPVAWLRTLDGDDPEDGDSYHPCAKGDRGAIPVYAEFELQELEQENNRLRAALANSELPCVYCTLPAEEWAKCKHGFPGCARADDVMGCPELGAKLDLAKYKQALAVAIAAIDDHNDQMRPVDHHACIDDFIAKMPKGSEVRTLKQARVINGEQSEEV